MSIAKAEDAVHAGPGPPTWRRFLDKRERVLEAERWLPRAGRRFLEVGAGLGYAGAIEKFRSPLSYVVVTDISPRYLERAQWVGIFIGGLAQAVPDAYVACDAEALPFRDGTFDSVWSAHVLYRVPRAVEAAWEMTRVLAPFGRWHGIEGAAPLIGPAARRIRKDMLARNAETGRAERPLTLGAWRRLIQRVGGAGGTVTLLSRRGLPPWARRLLNLVRPAHVLLEVRR